MPVSISFGAKSKSGVHAPPWYGLVLDATYDEPILHEVLDPSGKVAHVVTSPVDLVGSNVLAQAVFEAFWLAKETSFGVWAIEVLAELQFEGVQLLAVNNGGGDHELEIRCKNVRLRVNGTVVSLRKKHDLQKKTPPPPPLLLSPVVALTEEEKDAIKTAGLGEIIGVDPGGKSDTTVTISIDAGPAEVSIQKVKDFLKDYPFAKGGLFEPKQILFGEGPVAEYVTAPTLSGQGSLATLAGIPVVADAKMPADKAMLVSSDEAVVLTDISSVTTKAETLQSHVKSVVDKAFMEMKKSSPYKNL